MEDHFLYKLRNGQLQNKCNYRSKKITEYKKEANATFDFQKQFNKLLEKVLELQKTTLACMERIATFQNKQTEAIVKISNKLEELHSFNSTKNDCKKKTDFENFNKLSGSFKKINVKNTNLDKKTFTTRGLGTTDEKELFKTIKKMRENNYTWNAIAKYLQEKRISTLTGNGTWSPNLVLYFYKKMFAQDLQS